MLKLDLARLERDGDLRLQAAIDPDAGLLEGSDFTLAVPLQVDLTAQKTGTDQVWIRGRLEGTLAQQCRRCLEPLQTEIDREVDFVFSYPDELAGEDEGEDGEIRWIDPNVDHLDLAEAIREELILGLDRFPVCRPDCKGLCPQCGVNRNEEDCDCTLEATDPRWDALRALKNE